MVKVTGHHCPLIVSMIFALQVAFAIEAQTSSGETIRFGKSFPGLFQYTPFDVGLAKGFFKSQGLDVEVTSFNGNAKLVQAIAAGAIDLGGDGGPGLTAGRDRRVEDRPGLPGVSG